MDQVAGAGEVRAEDAFDVARVAAWLREHHAGLEGEPEVQQFSGGASNLTYLLRYPGRDLILRHAPRGTKARGAHDMHREYLIQEKLGRVLPYIAPLVAFCDDAAILGADFYVMERLDGVIPRKDWPADVPLDEAAATRLCENFVDTLVELHSVDPAAAGLSDLGKGFGYVRRQVDGWSTRFRNAHTDDVPDFEDAIAWLTEKQPDDVANRVIHNDYKFDNVVLDKSDPTRIIGILDWEMATLGDPLMDVAGALAYWVQADDDARLQEMRRVPTNRPGMITRAEFVERYCARMGFEMAPERWCWYDAFGMFRAVVIAQQIYYRYYHGQTSNPAFAAIGAGIPVLGERMYAAIESAG